MMSSRLSFNRAVARDTLRRCWPVWAFYLGFLLIVFPLPLMSEIHGTKSGGSEVLSRYRMLIMNNAVFQATAASAVAILAVMILFGYLYNNRGNTLMNSLPIRRETLFLTLYITGLLPMLLAQMLVTIILMLLTLSYGIGTSYYLKWFVCTALGLIAFYGFAVFCAMLTGNIIVLPALYFVLNLAAVGFEICFRICLEILVYGMSNSQMRFAFLSPIYKISESVRAIMRPTESVRVIGGPGAVQLQGLPVLALYASAGIIFAVLACLLYRKRRMECIADFVAIPVLKPIFRWCMGFGGALLLAAFLFSNFLKEMVFGTGAAALMAGILVIGALLSWVIAEMLIRRTVRVFPLEWKGLCAVSMICVLTVLAAETDLTGYERFVPDPQRVASAEFSYETRLTEPENIRSLTELHRKLIEDKSLFDRKHTVYSQNMLEQSDQMAETTLSDVETDFWMPITYTLSDGRVIQRTYTIRFRSGDIDNLDSLTGGLMREVLALLNSGEGIHSRMKPGLPMEEDYVNYAVITRERRDGIEHAYRLTPLETVELWNTAMLPDASEANLSLYTIVDTDENLKTQTSLRIEINLYDRNQNYDPYVWHHSYRVFTFSEHSLEWIKEHAGLEWETMDEVTAARYGQESEYYQNQ